MTFYHYGYGSRGFCRPCSTWGRSQFTEAAGVWAECSNRELGFGTDSVHEAHRLPASFHAAAPFRPQRYRCCTNLQYWTQGLIGNSNRLASEDRNGTMTPLGMSTIIAKVYCWYTPPCESTSWVPDLNDCKTESFSVTMTAFGN